VDSVVLVNLPSPTGGQPSYSPLAILTALTLRAVFRFALRQTEGSIGSIIRLSRPRHPHDTRQHGPDIRDLRRNLAVTAIRNGEERITADAIGAWQPSVYDRSLAG
jgi:hypothetical protein